MINIVNLANLIQCLGNNHDLVDAYFRDDGKEKKGMEYDQKVPQLYKAGQPKASWGRAKDRQQKFMS